MCGGDDHDENDNCDHTLIIVTIMIVMARIMMVLRMTAVKMVIKIIVAIVISRIFHFKDFFIYIHMNYIY